MSGQPLESRDGVGRVRRVATNVAVLLDDGSSSRRQEGVGIEFEGRGDSVNDHAVDRLENLKLRGELGQPVFGVDSSGVALDLVSPHKANVAVAELGNGPHTREDASMYRGGVIATMEVRAY